VEGIKCRALRVVVEDDVGKKIDDGRIERNDKGNLFRKNVDFMLHT